MLFFSLGLLVAVVLLAVIHVREARQRPLAPAIRWVMVAVVIPASAATAVQVHRIGDSEATKVAESRAARSPATER